MNKLLALIVAILVMIVISGVYNYHYNKSQENLINYYSGDVENNLNDTNEYVKQIKSDIEKIQIYENSKTIDIALTKEIYGDDVEEFKNALEIEDDVTGQLITDEKNFVTIIPTPDFLNNQTYFYKNGKIIAYREDFMGIGGSATYYFEDDKLVFVDETDVEEEMNFVSEDANNIIQRSQEIFKKFLSQF